jgi:hypothetical protein
MAPLTVMTPERPPGPQRSRTCRSRPRSCRCVGLLGARTLVFEAPRDAGQARANRSLADDSWHPSISSPALVSDVVPLLLRTPRPRTSSPEPSIPRAPKYPPCPVRACPRTHAAPAVSESECDVHRFPSSPAAHRRFSLSPTCPPHARYDARTPSHLSLRASCA